MSKRKIQIVKCIMMQKDEDIVLWPWIVYHGYMFGFNNIIILDNGSVKTKVKNSLEQLEKLGGKVYRQFDTKVDFELKGEIISNVIKILKRTEKFDFVFVLDCDEFIGLWKNDKISVDRSEINKYLCSLDKKEEWYRINTCMYNDPSRKGWYWPQEAKKGFVSSCFDGSIDRGFHEFKTQKGGRESNLTHFHYHFKPFLRFIEHCKEKLSHRLNIENDEEVKNYQGPGVHLIRNMLYNEENYIKQFNVFITVFLPDFCNLMSVLGCESTIIGFVSEYNEPNHIRVRKPSEVMECPGIEIIFDSNQYLEDNFDVNASGTKSIVHYLYCGYNEKNRKVKNIDISFVE
ncbi:Hypothetical protein GbCGDNIH9_7249 [Granulibacter bethesdensis]|uniref:Uncharacterized protein n=1 Tax=Granulibacter bethesdensis TaxID=364410 RepID=A0AAC9KA21_9PROT|nr:hypothetical protein [Granulibacter bethesdensis]APH54806.1 Hypothetical protein GbCGDNIH9_7249 [Granulibacter bethesdensis]APH62392.1 Hypothetical protein GbCGDNIH8_7249 [Granulibacter bethesdensis]